VAQQERFDLAIVGGGLVGAGLACALAESGLRLAVLEAVPFRSAAQPSYDDRTLALSQGSKRILDSMQLWPEVARRDATPIEHVHISDHGRPGMARLHARQFGVEALGYVVTARVLGQVLLERLQQCAARLEIFCPAIVDAVDPHPDHARLAWTDAAGVRHDIDTRLLVLADGGRSRTRELVGISAQVRDYRQSAVLCTVTPESGHGNWAYERFTSSGPLALLPTSSGRFAVVWTAGRDQVPELTSMPDDEFLLRLRQRAGDRAGRLDRVGQRNAYALNLVRVTDSVRPRTVVIGNAAHTVHPVAGQGFNLGLRDVAVLAELLHDAAAAGRDIGDTALLQRYASLRRRDTRAVAAFTDSLIRLFANDFPPAVIMRSLGLLALDTLPFAKRFLVRRTMGLAGWLPRLARGLPLG
jgi:2-octaprenyl-6-methoxyphenol hydroxylase